MRDKRKDKATDSGLDAAEAESQAELPSEGIPKTDALSEFGAPPTDPAAGEVDAVQKEAEQLHRELREVEDRHLRLAAEFDNFRKRTERERLQVSHRAQAEIVKQLLESLDDLARVIEATPPGADANSIVEGVALVQKKLFRALGERGLEPIEAVGKPFDPELHEAMAVTRTEVAEEDGIVSQQVSRGYMFRGELLRPALVEVKKYQAPPDERSGVGEPQA